MIVEGTARRNELRPEHMVGAWVELALGRDLASKDRKAPGVAVVQDLDELGPLVSRFLTDPRADGVSSSR